MLAELVHLRARKCLQVRVGWLSTWLSFGAAGQNTFIRTLRCLRAGNNCRSSAGGIGGDPAAAGIHPAVLQSAVPGALR